MFSNIEENACAKKLFQGHSEWFIADKNCTFLVGIKMKHWGEKIGKNLIQGNVIYMGKEKDPDYAKKIHDMILRNVKEKIPVRICYFLKIIH